MECDIDGDLGEVSGATKMGGSGWAAEDMFKKNANEFGVKSDYDATLTGYTVKLEKDQVSEYSKRRADALASQIEAQANYGVHLQHELDENMDEETKFSAVDESKTNNDNSGSRPSKYVPPSRRQPEPVKMNGTQQQQPGGQQQQQQQAAGQNKQQSNHSRQNSRNNSESERNKQLNKQPVQAKSPSMTPTPPPMLSKSGVEKKDVKKQNNNPRASPTDKRTSNNQV